MSKTGIEYLKSLSLGTEVFANEYELSDKYITVEGGLLLTWEEMEQWSTISWPYRASIKTCGAPIKTATPPPTDTRERPT